MRKSGQSISYELMINCWILGVYASNNDMEKHKLLERDREGVLNKKKKGHIGKKIVMNTLNSRDENLNLG